MKDLSLVLPFRTKKISTLNPTTAQTINYFVGGNEYSDVWPAWAINRLRVRIKKKYLVRKDQCHQILWASIAESSG